ncbi:MAG TPA: primosomal protein N' [Gemmatimonadales bacterium]|nr:primosomal protein N' [Gemmatimonadales bacterium]
MSREAPARFAEVALPLPVATGFIYRIPEALAQRAVPGARVLVPVRGRRALGLVVRTDVPLPEYDTREIFSAPDAEPALGEPLLELARWVSRYYGAPLGLTLRSVLPGPLFGAAGSAGKGAEASERVVTITRALPSLLERERAFARSPKRRVAYEAIEALGGSAPVRQLAERLHVTDAVIAGLATQGLARIERVTRTRDPFSGLATPPPPVLTDDQRRAILAIEGTPLDRPVLLHGVTGSGKTLVYLEVLRTLVERGDGAILLVPEIALTPQTVARVRGVFGDQVAVLHSGLSDGERADAWWALRRGTRRVAVGPRSALFAPVLRLRAIVVDEEHESSYKQGTTPRYHARDVAQVRARLEGARLILGSATPSLETLAQVADGRVVEVGLPERVGARPLPPVEVVDLRSAPRVEDAGIVPWTEALDARVRAALDAREQVILLLNRRGFSTFVQCPKCGVVVECPSCSIALTLHRGPEVLRCHYCAHQEPVAETCGACGNPTQRMGGLGTQQLEHFVALRFPAARLARMDLDTTSTKWAHHRILERFARGDVDVLVGTQMIAKGLDFPNVTVVGVVDADTGLHLPDFRAAERTFQLVAQVAGRAGRGPKGGRVIVQTRSPDHHAIRAAARHSVRAFAEAELPLRRPPHPAYPPTVSLARFVATAGQAAQAEEGARRAADWLRRASAERLGGALTVLGPAPCPIARLKGRWRWHVLVKAADGRALSRVVRAWRAGPRGRGGVVVDRDPVSLL